MPVPSSRQQRFQRAGGEFQVTQKFLNDVFTDTMLAEFVLRTTLGSRALW